MILRQIVREILADAFELPETISQSYRSVNDDFDIQAFRQRGLTLHDDDSILGHTIECYLHDFLREERTDEAGSIFSDRTSFDYLLHAAIDQESRKTRNAEIVCPEALRRKRSIPGFSA